MDQISIISIIIGTLFSVGCIIGLDALPRLIRKRRLSRLANEFGLSYIYRDKTNFNVIKGNINGHTINCYDRAKLSLNNMYMYGDPRELRKTILIIDGTINEMKSGLLVFCPVRILRREFNKLK